MVKWLGIKNGIYTVLVTGAGGPAGINTVLSLRKSRLFRVITTDITGICEGAFLSSKHFIISPALNENEFLRDLSSLIKNEKVDVVILTVDEEIAVLAKHLNAVDFSSKLIIHPRETIEICLNKLKTYEYLGKIVPNIVPEYSLDPKSLSSEIVVKKPMVGRGSRGVEVSKKCLMKEESGFFFVEYLPGREWTVDVVTDRSGNPIVIVPRIRLKTRGGVSVIGMVKLDGRIIEYTKRILSALRFTGPLNIQFREDGNSNPKLLEINPRFSGGLDITMSAGADLPRILVEYWLFNKKPKKIKIREGLYVKIYRTLRLTAEESGTLMM